MSITSAQQIVEDGIQMLDEDALKQILEHCKMHYSLAKQHAEQGGFADSVALTKSDGFQALGVLTVACSSILTMK